MKIKYQAEKKALEEKLKGISHRQDTWIQTAEQAFNFSVHARHWFKKEQKRIIA